MSPVNKTCRQVVAIVASCRPQQWVKNLLLFAVPLGAGKLFDPATIWTTLYAVGCFCLASGGAYLVNDSLDIEQDKLHAQKQWRPVASGKLTAQQAMRAGIGLSTLAVLLTVGLPAEFSLLLATYVVLTLLYTFYLKHFVLIDITVLATGFMLRVLGGGLANHLYTSGWLLGVIGLVSLGIGAGKRHSELGAQNKQPILRGYAERTLKVVRLLAFVMALILYKGWLWRNQTGGVAGVGSAIMFGLWLLRFEQLTRQNRTTQPDETITSDPLLVTCGALWFVLILLEIHKALT